MSVTRSTRTYPMLGLMFAKEALADAESVKWADDEEVMGLCDEVIRRRLQLHDHQLANGATPSAPRCAQMDRDRILLRQSCRLLATPSAEDY